MGVSVSDYALVMDKYEFSLKDLLERGPGEAYWMLPSVLEEVFTRDNVPEALSGHHPGPRRSRTLRGRADVARRPSSGSAFARPSSRRRPDTSC